MTARALGICLGILTSSLVTACGGHAEPPRFPDLSRYTPVDMADYQIAFDNPGRPPNQIVHFLSPDGVICKVDYWDAACSGNNLPGLPSVPDPKVSIHYMDTQSGLRQAAIPRHIVNNTIHDQPIRTLPPFHSIMTRGSICGVDDKKMIACKDLRGRGFILSPSWSGWLDDVD